MLNRSLLIQDRFVRLFGDNPELRLELTAQEEIIVMSPTNSVIELWWPSDILNEIQFKLDEYVAMARNSDFCYPPQRNVYVYRPGRIPNVWTILNPCRAIPNSLASRWT
jgi:hypothetical protein